MARLDRVSDRAGHFLHFEGFPNTLDKKIGSRFKTPYLSFD